MPGSQDFNFSEEQGRLQEILMKIVIYQSSLPDGRAVEMEELKREGVLSSADLEFLAANSVTYHPCRMSDQCSMEMLQMPFRDDG